MIFFTKILNLSLSKYREFWKFVVKQKLYKEFAGRSLLLSYYVFHRLPLNFCSSFGGLVIGKILAIKSKRENQRLRDNIRSLFPNIKSCEELERIQKAVWDHRGRLAVEYMKLYDVLESKSTSIQGHNNLIKTQSYNRPIIFIFLHLGNWSVISRIIGELLNWRILQPYKVQKNPYLNKILEMTRKPYADYIIRDDELSTKMMIAKLREGIAFFIGIDAFYKGRSVVPSFGRGLKGSKGNNLVKAIKLAKLTNAVLCPVYTLRKEKKSEFVLHILPPIAPDFEHFDDNEFDKTVHEIDQLMGAVICENIEQWLYITSVEINNPISCDKGVKAA